MIAALLKQKADVLGWNLLRIGGRKTRASSVCLTINAYVKALEIFPPQYSFLGWWILLFSVFFSLLNPNLLSCVAGHCSDTTFAFNAYGS